MTSEPSPAPDQYSAPDPGRLEMIVYEGGCHCGAVRFRVQVRPDERMAVDCNCSICRKKGFLHLIVPSDRFTLLQGEAALTTYTFNTGVAQHTFCRTCGIHGFYRPRSHPDGFDVNVRCLDGEVLDQFSIEPFNGQAWEESRSSLDHLPYDSMQGT